ncbi:MAG: MOSC domain-containing protein [Chthoniobacterales bacterium]
MKVEAIYLSPGHNFFGRFGTSAGSHPTIEVGEAECVAGMGLRGDRFFGYQADYKGQITFLAREVFEDLSRALGVHDRTPSVFRRNVLTSGVDLNELLGCEFELQGMRFAGVVECSPCVWMDQAFGPGAEELLKGRGGLRARILSSGVLRTERP